MLVGIVGVIVRIVLCGVASIIISTRLPRCINTFFSGLLCLVTTRRPRCITNSVFAGLFFQVALGATVSLKTLTGGSAGVWTSELISIATVAFSITRIHACSRIKVLLVALITVKACVIALFTL